VKKFEAKENPEHNSLLRMLTPMLFDRAALLSDVETAIERAIM
jgi:hypothetical protein